jgi:hypothetical protein
VRANRTPADAHLRTFAAVGMSSTMSRDMRIILCFLLSLIAALSAFAGMTVPLRAPAQAAENRVYYEHFRAAAEIIDKGYQLPSVEAQLKEQFTSTGPIIRTSLTIPFDCDLSITKAAGDQLILSFWRGEWTECFAYPSGRTSLHLSVREILLSGTGVSIAIFWLVAAGAAWAAIRLRPGRQVAASSIPNGS